MSHFQVRQITTYPLKSTRGQDHSAVVLGRRGLGYDRHWALIDAAGTVLSGRKLPQLLDLDARVANGRLWVVGPTMASSFEGSIDRYEESVLEVRFFGRDWPARGVSSAADTWFSEALGVDCRLIYLPPDITRTIPERHGGRAGDEVAFPDKAPLLLITEPSLADLNARLAEPIGADRFRANLLLAGPIPPYAEDRWQYLRIGDCEFDVMGTCKRCVFTAIDPRTKEKHPRNEPLPTLASYRREGGSIPFGIYLTPRKLGTLRVDDVVEVLR